MRPQVTVVAAARTLSDDGTGLAEMSAQLCQATAELFRALSHPVRIRVLELLQDGPRPVHELLQEIGVDASSLTQQLVALRRCGIVSSTRDGPVISYQLSTSEVAALMDIAHETMAAMVTKHPEVLLEPRRGALAR